jgi:hypothetical protein
MDYTLFAKPSLGTFWRDLASQEVIYEGRAGDKHELSVCSFNIFGILNGVPDSAVVRGPPVEL